MKKAQVCLKQVKNVLIYFLVFLYIYWKNKHCSNLEREKQSPFFSCTKAWQMDTNAQPERADKVGDTAQLTTQ